MTPPSQPSNGRRPSPGGWRHVVALTAATLVAGACTSEDPVDALWGKDTVARPCVVCHSLHKDGPFRVAPNLWGIVGAPKARDRDWYGYSPGLIAVGGTWTRQELDRFLADPVAFAPGTRMNFRVPDDRERAEIIEFLAGLQD